MSKKSSSKTNFLAQGTILVIASFVAKAIGMIYRIPLTHILGMTETVIILLQMRFILLS